MMHNGMEHFLHFLVLEEKGMTLILNIRNENLFADVKVININICDDFCVDICHNWRLVDIGPTFVQIPLQVVADQKFVSSFSK